MLIEKFYKDYKLENPKASLKELQTSGEVQKDDFCSWFMRNKVEPIIMKKQQRKRKHQVKELNELRESNEDQEMI